MKAIGEGGDPCAQQLLPSPCQVPGKTSFITCQLPPEGRLGPRGLKTPFSLCLGKEEDPLRSRCCLNQRPSPRHSPGPRFPKLLSPASELASLCEDSTGLPSSHHC